MGSRRAPRPFRDRLWDRIEGFLETLDEKLDERLDAGYDDAEISIEAHGILQEMKRENAIRAGAVPVTEEPTRAAGAWNMDGSPEWEPDDVPTAPAIEERT